MPLIPIVVSVVVMVTPHRGKQTHTREIVAAVQEHNRAAPPRRVMNSRLFMSGFPGGPGTLIGAIYAWTKRRI
jgi:hypothetical protein